MKVYRHPATSPLKLMRARRRLWMGASRFWRLTFCFIAAAALLGAACKTAQPPTSQVEIANAALRNQARDEVATALLVQAKRGVMISVEVDDLPPGKYTLRVHSFAKCEGEGFLSAGDVFPVGASSGAPELTFKVGKEGTGEGASFRRDLTLGLKPDKGRFSLFHPGGTSLVLHSFSGNRGVLGESIACGIVQPGGPSAGEIVDSPQGGMGTARHSNSRTLGMPRETYRQPK